MGKIGDLFVRLGLKSDGFKKGMDNAKKETQTFGSKLKSMKAGALAVWAAIGTAVVKFGQDFISATNKIGDAWEVQMRGMKAAYNSVLADFTNYKPDTSSIRNFFKGEWEWIKKTFGNAKEAADAGKEAAKAFDAEFELTQSVALQRKQIQQELNELYAIMRDTSKSNEIRKKAQERYKALLQPIADAEVAVYSNMLDAAITEWQAGTGLNRTRDEIVEFFSKIGIETEAMAAKFPDIYDVFNNRKGDKTNLQIFDIIGKYQDAANQMSNVEKEMARVTNAINADIKRGLDAQVKEIEKAADEKLKLDLKLDVKFEEFDWSAVEDEFKANLENLQNTLSKEYAEIDNLNQMLAQSMASAFSEGLQALTDFVVGIDSASVEQVISAFIQPIAGMMKHMGEMFMAEGIAELQLITGTPAQKIAAGAALIAVSSAISSGLAKMAGAMGGTSASTSAAGSSANANTQTYEQEITINVVGELSGDKIILAGQKTLNKWNR
jgi:hypothetical protein